MSTQEPEKRKSNDNEIKSISKRAIFRFGFVSFRSVLLIYIFHVISFSLVEILPSIFYISIYKRWKPTKSNEFLVAVVCELRITGHPSIFHQYWWLTLLTISWKRKTITDSSVYFVLICILSLTVIEKCHHHQMNGSVGREH